MENTLTEKVTRRSFNLIGPDKTQFVEKELGGPLDAELEEILDKKILREPIYRSSSSNIYKNIARSIKINMADKLDLALDGALSQWAHDCANNIVEEIKKDTGNKGFNYYSLHFMIYEVIKNAQKHGNELDSSKIVTVNYEYDGKKFAAEVIDQAAFPCKKNVNRLIEKGTESKNMPLKEFNDLLMSMDKKRIELGKPTGGVGLYTLGRGMDKAYHYHKKGVGNVTYMEKQRKT